MIGYEIEHNLNPNALLKMQESIPYFMKYITDIMVESSTCEEFLERVRETGYLVRDWLPHSVHGLIYKSDLKEYEVCIFLINTRSAHFKIKFSIISIMRDNKISKILEK